LEEGFASDDVPTAMIVHRDEHNYVDSDYKLALELSKSETETSTLSVDSRPSSDSQWKGSYRSPMWENASSTDDRDYQLALELSRENEPQMDGRRVKNNRSSFTYWNEDWMLARALQAMEFEIGAEIRQREPESSFIIQESNAATCKKQMLTVSTLIAFIQICLLIAMIEESCIVPSSENPSIGPATWTMVKTGAVEAGLVIVRKQWWRLLAAIFLHAGIVHLICNVLVQLRVGGYLTLLYGTPRWLWIYLISGFFGNMFSVVLLANDVAVGSSGSLMGMLSSWVVWILYRWKKVPQEYHKQRNCQLFVVVLSIAITLAMSFTPFVDWAAHLGGAVQGILWGLSLFVDELQITKKWKKYIIIIIPATIALGACLWCILHMVYVEQPSTANFAYWDMSHGWRYQCIPEQTNQKAKGKI